VLGLVSIRQLGEFDIKLEVNNVQTKVNINIKNVNKSISTRKYASDHLWRENSIISQPRLGAVAKPLNNSISFHCTTLHLVNHLHLSFRFLYALLEQDI
jgi:hypothetical protein